MLCITRVNASWMSEGTAEGAEGTTAEGTAEVLR